MICLSATVTVAPGVLILLPGCERSDLRATPSPTPRTHTAAIIEFPDTLKVDDPTVNAFIDEAIRTCVAEDYEAFRLLWSALEKPISAQEFHRGWRAAQKVSIVNLAPWRTKENEIVYGIYVRVELDPREVPQPQREVCLLLVKENDAWRVAKAPKNVCRTLKGETEEADPTDTDTDTDTTGLDTPAGAATAP